MVAEADFPHWVDEMSLSNAESLATCEKTRRLNALFRILPTLCKSACIVHASGRSKKFDQGPVGCVVAVLVFKHCCQAATQDAADRIEMLVCGCTRDQPWTFVLLSVVCR